MRRMGFLVLAAALAACGKSSSQSSASAASGTIMGSGFTPADSGALSTTFTCDFGTGPRSVSVLALGFSSFANVCGFATNAGLCGDVASSLIVSVTILSAPASGTAAPIGPGTYTMGTHIDQNNNVVSADATIAKVDATCTPATGIPTVPSGTITISGTSPRLTGSLDLTFEDGSHFAGALDLAPCGAPVDFCSLVTGSCTTPVCCSSPTSCP